MVLLLLYHTFVFISLFSFGLYHLTLSLRSSLKSPSSHLARPFHPLPFLTSSFLRHLPLYLSLLSLLISISHSLALSLSSSISSLHTALSLSLFLLLALSLLFFPLPSDLTFLFSSLAFLLLSYSPSSPSPDLQSHARSLSSSICLSSSASSLALAVSPKLFVFEIALFSSLSLQGLFSLHSALALYVDRFVPAGCHRLLDVSYPTTRCDLDDTRIRAQQILDLALAADAAIVALIVAAIYVGLAKAYAGAGGAGGLGRRCNGGSYEALPTSSSVVSLADLDHVQMKAMGKSSTQA